MGEEARHLGRKKEKIIPRPGSRQPDAVELAALADVSRFLLSVGAFSRTHIL